jgi:ketosteroid isomerase-like protein
MSQRDADAITRLQYAYADAVLASDEAWWGSLWTEDARWDLGPDRAIDGRAAIVEHWRGSIATYRRVVQLYLSSTATIDGDEAHGRAYFVELNVPVDGDRRVLAAYYDDRYRRSAEGWRYASRTLGRLYQGLPDLSGTFFPDIE